MIKTILKQGFAIPQLWKLIVIMLVIGVMALTPAPNSERIGDRLQYALPILGLACSISNGDAVEYAIRYIAVEIVLKSSKIGLGTRELNRRPNGDYYGFPSGHTTAAAYGASYLVHSCIERNLLVKGAVIISAGYVGSSRIEADKHTVIQVLFGVLLGWGGDRLLRRTAAPAFRRLKTRWSTRKGKKD